MEVAVKYVPEVRFGGYLSAMFVSSRKKEDNKHGRKL